MKPRLETETESKPRRFFSPETSLFQPIFATEYEVSSNSNQLRDVKNKSNLLTKSFAQGEKRPPGRGLPRLIGASRNSPMESRHNQDQTGMVPSPKFSNLADYVHGPPQRAKTRWNRKEVRAEQLITNSSLLRELKSVIGAREKKRAKLDFQIKPKTRHGDSVPWSTKRQQIEEEAFIDFRKTSTKAVSTKRSEVTSPRNMRTPGTPAYDFILSNESFMSKETGILRAPQFARQAVTPQVGAQKKLPLHMNHPLIGIKPILLGADTADQVKRAAGSLRSSQGEEEIMRILHGEGLKEREVYRRSSSVEPGKSRALRHSRKNFNVSYLLTNERPLHQMLLESITNLNFLKSEFETQFEDLCTIAQKEGKIEEDVIQGKQADLYGLHLVLSEMSSKLANISQEEKIGFVQDNLEQTLKDLSKIYRVINKEIYRNIHPPLVSQDCETFDKFKFCEELRSELFVVLLKHIREQLVGGGGEAKTPGSESNPFQDSNLQQDRVRQIVGLVLESVEQKFQLFCKDTSHKTLQAMLILEQCWKLGLMPYETIYSNRDFLLQQEVQLFKQKMKVKEDELNSQKADLEFSVKELKESQKKELESLKIAIERLKRDNERLIAIVQDRQDEMRMMKDQRARPHQALNNYLTEMEDLLHGTLQERRKQMETMGMMADVCTVDIPETNTQMKRMKRRKLKSRRSYLDQAKPARFHSPARSDREPVSARNQVGTDRSYPSSSRDVRSKSMLITGGGGSPLRNSQLPFLEAVQETPRDAEQLAKEWENCSTIEELAQLFKHNLFKEEEIFQVKEMIKDMYLVAGQEARADVKRLNTPQKKNDSSKIVVEKTETQVKEEAKMKKRPSLTLKGIFSSAASNPNF